MRLPWRSKDGGQQCVPLKKPLLGGEALGCWVASQPIGPLSPLIHRNNLGHDTSLR